MHRSNVLLYMYVGWHFLTNAETAASRWRQQRARRWSQAVFQVLQNAVRETRRGSVQHAQFKRLEKRRVYRQRHHVLAKWRQFAGERRWRMRAGDLIHSRASKHSLRWCMALWISQHIALRARSCQRVFRRVCVCMRPHTVLPNYYSVFSSPDRQTSAPDRQIHVHGCITGYGNMCCVCPHTVLHA